MNINAETRKTMLRQIGFHNFLAISGGRALALPDGVQMPVGAGYSVEVRYIAGADHYEVERVFTRAGKRFSKGTETAVYADTLGETAYRASCFRNDDAEYWPEALTI